MVSNIYQILLDRFVKNVINRTTFQHTCTGVLISP